MLCTKFGGNFLITFEVSLKNTWLIVCRHGVCITVKFISVSVLLIVVLCDAQLQIYTVSRKK